MTSLVMSFIGRDKPGLVGLLSKTVAEHKGNWLESGMSRLGGQFAGILVIQVPVEEQEALIQALRGLESQGLKVSVERSEQAETEASVRAVTLDLIGHDKPGIVRDISRALAEMQINVHKMQTELTSGSMSGELLFKASAELQVPTPVDLDELQEKLEAIASDLMVDITLN
ncbi:glycine cleavage system protein R [Marinobacterium sp. D7]|uniref:glycine cleavage system protein R n=1 Tax=Marinobacterium ramblicola TaxID=2849041 RepID=UPI001C2D2152|nr:ACT domain-containing protein [Marinobacterium ramblicola]MBV1787888.1 glycine cleavage system protein R [Marinobacterium ramblicola]